MDDIVQERNWERLAVLPGPSLVPVIREFYANARIQLIDDPQQRSALVRGIQVPFDRASINALCGLPNMEGDQYTEFLARGPDYEAIIRFLAGPEAQWKKTRDRFVNFPRSQLKVESRGWHYFISATLLPTFHLSNVTRERAVLNYAIQNEMSIDIGGLIERSIVSFIRSERIGGLGHPSLLYALCLRAGVPTSAAEEIQHPLPPVTSLMLESFLKAGATTSDHSEEEPAPEPAEAGPSSAPPPQSHPQSTASTSTTPDLASLYHKMEAMERRQSQMATQMGAVERRQSSMARQLEYLVEAQMRHQQYTMDFNNALSAMFRSSTSFQGQSTVVFPTFTPPTPPEDPDSSSSESF